MYEDDILSFSLKISLNSLDISLRASVCENTDILPSHYSKMRTEVFWTLERECVRTLGVGMPLWGKGGRGPQRGLVSIS